MVNHICADNKTETRAGKRGKAAKTAGSTGLSPLSPPGEGPGVRGLPNC